MRRVFPHALGHKLALSTALSTSILLTPAAFAQHVPVQSDVVGGTAGVTVTPASLPTSGTQPTASTITVTAPRSVINWSEFNVPTGTSATFTTATPPATPLVPYSVLNRVVGGEGPIPKTTIDGTLSAPSNMQIYIINSSGILFGSSAVVNVGSLIASTRNITDAEFGRGFAAMHFRPVTSESSEGTAFTSATGGNGVTVDAGAKITTTGTPSAAVPSAGGLYLVGAQVLVNAPTGTDPKATLTATNGDTAFVAADDVTITPSAGSPLAIMITRGTRIAGAVNVAGTVSGRSVVLALASRDSIVDTLVAAGSLDATGATAAGGGVVLTAGANGGGVTLTPGVAADIDPTGAIQSTATLTSTRGATATAARAISTGAVTVTGPLSLVAGLGGPGGITAGALSGSSITLQSAGLAQAASLTTTGGPIGVTGTGGLTVTGGIKAVGASDEFGDITIDRTGAVSAGSFSAGRDLTIGGTTVPTSVTVTGTTGVGRNLAVTTTLAQSFTGAITVTTGSATLASTGGAIGVGTLQAAGDASLHGTAVTATSVASTNAGATLTADTGDVTVGGLGAGTDARVTAASGTASITGAVKAGRDYIVAAKSVTLGAGATAATQQAARNVDITASTGTIAGGAGLILRGAAQAGATGTLVLDGAGGIALDAGSTIDSVAPGSPAASGTLDVGIRAGSGTSVALGSVTARRLTGADGTHALTDALALTGPVTLGGPVTVAQSLDLSTSGGTLTTHQVSVTGTAADLTLTTTGVGNDLTALGTLTAGNDLTLSAARDLRFTTAAATAGAASATSGTASPTTATGLISGTSLTAGGTASAIANSSLSLGNIAGTTVTGTGGTTATIGSITAGAGATITADDGAASVTGTVLVTGDYAVSGSGVTLGTADTLVKQSASGAVTITASGGPITGEPKLVLTSDTGGGGNPLTLSSGGDILFKGATLNGGTASTALVQINSGSDAGIVTLGNVTALGLVSSVGEEAYETGITRTSAITVGDVTLKQALLLDAGAAAITGGALTGSSVTLTTTAGAIGATSLQATDGAVTVTGGSLNVTGAIGAGGTPGDVLIDSGGAVSAGSFSAGRDLTIGGTTVPTSVTVTGTTGVGRNLAVTTTLAQSFTGAITVTTGSATLASTGGAIGVGTLQAAGDASLHGTAVTATSVASTNAGATLTADTGDVTVGGLGAGTDARVTAASGTASITGAVKAGRDHIVAAKSVTLGAGATAATQQAARNVDITASTGTIAGGAGLILRGAAQAGATGTLVLDGAGGIALDAGSTIDSVAPGSPAASGTLDVGIRAGSGTSVALGSVTARRLTGADGTHALTDALALTGPVTLGGPVTVAQSLDLSTSGGTLTTHQVSVTGTAADLTLTTTGVGNDLTALGTLTAGNDLTLSAARDLRFTTAAATAGAASATSGTASPTTATGLISGTSLTAGGTASAIANSSLSLDTLSGTAATGTGGTDVTIGTGFATSGLLDLEATAGTLRLTSGTGVGGVRLSAGGAAQIGTANATGPDADLTLVKATDVGGLTAGSPTSFTATRDLSLTASGTMLLATASGGRNATLQAGALDVANLIATAGLAKATASTGDAKIGTITAGGGASIEATIGAALIPGAVTVTGNYAVTGGSVTLGVADTPVAQSASGAVTIAAASTLTGSPGLTLLANKDGIGAEPLTLVTTASGGRIAFAGTTLLGGPNSESVVQIRSASSGDGVVLGDITALGLEGAVGSPTTVPFTTGIARTSPLTVGTVTLKQGLALSTSSTLTALALQAASVTLTSGGTTAAIPSITATGGAVTIGGTGPFAVAGAISATNAPGAPGDIVIDQAGPVTAGSLAAGNAITIGKTTPAASLTVSGTTQAGSNLAVTTSGAQTYKALVNSGGTATLTATGGPLQLVDLTSAGNATLQATSVTATSVKSSGGLASLTASGAITVPTVTGIGVSGTGGTVAIATLADAGSGTLKLSATSGGLSLFEGRAGTDVTLSAVGDALIGKATAGADLTITQAASVLGYAGGASRTMLQAGHDLSVTASGPVRIDTAQAANNATVTGGSIDATSATATGGTLKLTATAGGLTVTTATGAAGVTLSATGAAAIGTANATGSGADLVLTQAASLAGIADGSRAILSAGHDIDATVSGSMLVGPVSAGNLAKLTAGSIDLSTLDAGATTLLATGGDITATRVTVGGTAMATATAGTVRIANVQAASTIVDAGIVDLTTVRGGTLMATSLAGPLHIADFQISGDATLKAATDATIDTGTSTGGGIAIDAGGLITSPTLTAANLVRANGAALTLGTVTGGDVALTASSGALLLNSATATNTITLTKTGTTGGITVSGSLAAGAGNMVGDITVASATSFTAPLITASRAVTITTGGLTTLPSITSGSLAITSTDAVALTSLAIAGDATVKASGAVTIDGPATTGSLDVTGGTITLGASSGTTLQQARGDLAFTATQGGITGLSGLTLLSDSDGDGIGDLILRGTTGVTFAAGTSVLGGPDRSAVARIAPGAGAPLTLDTLTARTLVSWEPTLAATSFTHDGSVTINTLRVRDDTSITLTGVSSALTLGTAESGGGLALATDGILLADSLKAATTLSARGGTATIGSAQAATVTLASTAGTLDTTSATASGDASLSAAGSLRLGTATAGGQLSVRAGGDVTGRALEGGGYARTLLTGTSGVDVATQESGDAGGAVLIDQVSSAGAISVAGRALDINGAVSSGGPISLTARPNGAASAVSLSVGTVDAGTSATLSSGIGGNPASSANGAILVDSAIARNGALTLTAADGGLSARDGLSGSVLTARGVGGDVTATLGTTATIATIAADRDISIVAGDAAVAGRDGGIAIGTATAGRALLLQAYHGAATGTAGITLGSGSAASATFRTLGSRGSIAVGPLQVSGPITFASVGDVTLPQAVSAGGDVTLTATGTFDAADLSAASLTANAGEAVLGRVRTGGDIAVSAGTITAQDLASSGGRLTLIATGGDLALVSGTAAGTATLSATGGATIGTLATTNGDIAITSGGALTGQNLTAGGGITAKGAALTLDTLAADGGPLALTATQGDLGLSTGTASGNATLASNGAITIGTLRSSGGVINATAVGALTADALTSAAGQTLAASAISVSRLAAGGDLAATTGNGLLDLPDATVGGMAKLTAGGDARIGALTTQNGALTVQAGGQAIATTLTSAGDLTIGADAATLGSVAASGAVAATTQAGDLTLATIRSGTGTTLTSARDVAVSGDATIGGAFRVTGNGVTLGSTGSTATQTAGGLVALVARTDAITGRAGLTLTSGAAGMTLTATGGNGTITLDPASSIVAQGGAITAETAGLATLGTVKAGTSATISATDLTLAAAVTAPAVTLVNRSPANLTQIGETPAASANASEFATGGTRFGLSSDELGRVSAGQFVVDAQSGAVQLGEVTLAAGAGQQLFQIRTSGRMDVLGRFVAAGSPTSRVIVLGGDATDTGRASVLRVASTAAGGGRLLVDSGTLDLRADRIALGMDTAFQAALGLTPGGTPASASDVATRYVAQPSSTLYNAALGNAQGIYSDPTLLRADRLIVRYADFALFQNTGLPSVTSGVVLGGTTPVEPALELLPAAGTNAFALFGTVNGIGGTAAALLGARQIVVGPDTSRGNSRANGCVIGGGGAGCLSNSIVQPTLNIFDVSRADVFRSAEDLTLPFDPLVSTSNEALFSDIASISQSAELNPCPEGAKDCPQPGPGR